MGSGLVKRVNPLERISPTLFLLGGGLLVAYASLNGFVLATGGEDIVVENVVGPAGFVLGFLGLLGLAPGLLDRTPWLAKGGAGAAILGVVGFTTITVATLGRLAGVLGSEPPAWFPVLLGLVVVGMGPGFVAFGLASFRDAARPRVLGLLLLAPPAIFGMMLAGMVTGAAPYWSEFAISTGQALAYLSIGLALRAEAGSTDRASSTETEGTGAPATETAD